MAPRETEDNAYTKFWGDKQRALWYVMVFLEWSITVYNFVLRYKDVYSANFWEHKYRAEMKENVLQFKRSYDH